MTAPSARLRAATAREITYHGRRCKQRGHGTLKYTSSSTCVACVAASSKARNATIRNLLKGNTNG